MENLSRSEEMILLSIWNLQREAYGVRILEKLKEKTGTAWTIGAVYAPLHRLEEKGFIESRAGEPLPVRGGRSRIFYRVTSRGKTVLAAAKAVHDALWDGAPDLGMEKA
jgi:PadR family transcriptional regulator PadR